MENNSTETLVKLTDKEHFQLFMQYADQAIYCNGNIPQTMAGAHGGCITAFYPRENKITVYGSTYYAHEFHGFAILVKSLDKISDENKVHLQKIIGYTHWINVKAFFNAVERKSTVLGSFLGPPEKIQAAIDFLRAEGYALPWGKFSIDQLVKAGIFKIIE